MAFGLRNAPATYQRLMSHVLSGYIGKFCHVFIDDIICFSKSYEEHLEHLHLIFERLERAGLKLKPSKCSFAKTEVKYLGHLVAPGEIRPDPSNIEKVRNLAPPTTVKGVREIVGLASYYRSFVPDFSQRASPLTEMTKKNVSFQWGPEQQRAFDDLKQALTSEPVLALPDFTNPFILMTDGSTTGLGAVLSQDHGHAKERVVAYASKKTSPLERNYAACELECLALVWAVRAFREYLLGRHTIIITDHWALKWLMTLEHATPRPQRWRMALQEYDLEIAHKAGKQHCNADFMSRLHEHFGDESEDEAKKDETPSKGQPQMNRTNKREATDLLTCGRGWEPDSEDQFESSGDRNYNEDQDKAGQQEVREVMNVSGGKKKSGMENEKHGGGNRSEKPQTKQALQTDDQVQHRKETKQKYAPEYRRGGPKDSEKKANEEMGRQALKEAQREDEDCQHLIRICLEKRLRNTGIEITHFGWLPTGYWRKPPAT